MRSFERPPNLFMALSTLNNFIFVDHECSGKLKTMDEMVGDGVAWSASNSSNLGTSPENKPCKYNVDYWKTQEFNVMVIQSFGRILEYYR